MHLLRSLYLSQPFFWSLFSIAMVFLFSYWMDFLYPVAWILITLLFLLLMIDLGFLYKIQGIQAERKLPERFSNSDENPVRILLTNKYSFRARCEVIDELPPQFQKRDFLLRMALEPGAKQECKYWLRPVKRGEYVFGKLNVFTRGPLTLIKRRSVFSQDKMVKVYPSFLQMKTLELLALDRRSSQSGLKRIRRIGHTMEFEQIKDYVSGDDVRTINWKATAKHGDLMVNQYQDEKSQPLYAVIDTGRVMKMPFGQMSLLDYSINATLAFSQVALKKKDKVGMISFSNTMDPFIKAEAKAVQLQRILERLYKLETDFKETDFELLYAHIRKKLPHRSLVMLYTNFEHMAGLQRCLPYLKALAKKHLLVVIFFENVRLREFSGGVPKDPHQAAHQTVAQEFLYNKKLMVKELQQHGIQAILSKPADLSVKTINKYLEIKARGLL